VSALQRWYSRPRRVLLLFAVACTVLLAVAAGVPLGYLPGTLEKSIGVVVDLEGAFESEVEREIVVPLENALAGLAGVEEIFSLCDRGRGRVALRFLADTDLDRAYAEVRAAVEAVSLGFPQRAQRPVILKSNPDSRPVFAAAFPAPTPTLDAGPADGTQPGDSTQPGDGTQPAESEDTLKRAYGGIEGVGEIQIGGSGRYEVLVQFDPPKLAAAGLSVRDLVRAVRLNNVVGGFAAPGQAPRVVDSRIRTLQDLKELRLTPSLRLAEVAEVTLSRSAGQSIGRVNGGPRLLVYVQAAGDANTVALCCRLRLLTRSISGGEILLDEGGRIEKALREVAGSVLAGVALVVLLTVLVQRRLSAALAAALGVPFAVLAAVAAVRACGRELDLVSLAGTAVGVGLAIDAGVVFVEEYFRLEGRSARVLASVVGPLLFSAATTLVVFVPLGFAPQTLRDSLGGLAVAVASAVVASTLYVFFVLPVLLERFCAVSTTRPGGGSDGGPPRGLMRSLRRAFFAAARLRLPVGLALAAAVAAATLVAVRLPRAPFGLIADQAMSFSVEYPTGWSKEAVFARTEPFERFLCSLEGVRFVSARYERERAAFYLVPEESADLETVVARVRERGSRLRDGFLYIPRSTPGGGPAEVFLTGPGLETLRRIAVDLAGRMHSVSGVDRVVFHFKEALPSRVLQVDLAGAARAGVNPLELYQQLLWSLAAPVADKWTTGLEERDIRIGAWSGESWSLEALLETSVGGSGRGGAAGSLSHGLAAGGVASTGAAVPLRALVRLSEQAESGRIYRTNRQRSLSFEVAISRRGGGRPAARRALRQGGATAHELQRLIRDYSFPPEYRAVLRLGDPRQALLTRSLLSGLLLGLLLILCVLLFQFEAVWPAAVVMLQIPLSFVLPLLVLRLAGLPLSVPAMVGLLLTAGITVNNAILVLDAAGARAGRRGGALSVTRLYHALGKRLRAIFLASLTTVLGVVPLVLAGRANQGVLAPLSLTIAAGIAGSLGALILSLAVVGRRAGSPGPVGR